ncbi:MAG: hydrogenase maturation protease [Anaerolineales bacterium]
MKTLVLGLGNPLLKDDSVGLRVAKMLREILPQNEQIEIDEDYWGGLRLMERMIGFDRAVIIDAIQTGAAPGTIHVLSPDDVPTQRSASAHDMNLPTALALGRQAGAYLPDSKDILLIGIEAADVQTFDESLSPEVEAALPHAVDAALFALEMEREIQ